MTKPQFPDLTYLVTKLYEGINRPDYAELAAGIVPRVREGLQNYKPQISDPIDRIGYEAILQSVVRHLDEFEQYYQSFNNNEPRISKTAAGGIHASLSKQVHALEQLSKR